MQGTTCTHGYNAKQHRLIPELLDTLEFYKSPEGVSREGGIAARVILKKWAEATNDRQ